jgi:hypothetical protein
VAASVVVGGVLLAGDQLLGGGTSLSLKVV